MDLLQAHRAIQGIARQVLAELALQIDAQDTEASIAAKATAIMASHGIRHTWYYECPAFVLLGSRSQVSISGRDYRPSDEKVGEINLITVDVSPALGEVWGDCARSFCVENGRVTAQATLPIFQQGLQAELQLHSELIEIARPDMRGGELFAWANARIQELGFRNLDFLGNVGHSIATRRENRFFIEQGQQKRLGDMLCFTFEPHIAADERWGFKHEEIYAFDADGRLSPI
ncbi:M24 family metallopeptidase [Chitinibacter sp. GC72]|uniref:M24 family metallopeptidase n=1 Tax=Chitinibacter sp. GC72 TaxID=1526917 RepID=UPI0018DFDE81|nr:M24 family metallopeptidase [Chitinibacter sp. GC72]